VRSLPKDVTLTEAKNSATASTSDAEATVRRAEARLVVARAAVASVEATIAADNAKFHGGAADEFLAELAKIAARQQALLAMSVAQFELLGETDDKKIKAAQSRIKEIDERLAKIEQGDFQYQSIRGAKKALESPADKEQDHPATYSATSTGRRTALARWVTSRDNPLTARVAVNHVWMRHFGQPLVESVFDFGLRAPRPEHADVLDLLAYEFMESGWSFRHLHRLIVTSATYRLSSSSAGADELTIATDPTNDLYWRMNSRRMESQVVRDSLLGLAGVLDLQIGGPSIDPSQGGTRRSIYFKHSRDQQDTFLAMFDDADLLQCYRRSESVVPQQALALSNSKLSIEMADKIAEKLSASVAGDDYQAFVDAAFESLLGRMPTDAERAECQTFQTELAELLQQQQVHEPGERLRARFVQALLNHNDFISIR
jgi:hypothetical protein